MAAESIAFEGRLPNLVIAGVSKAGTTSLFHYLGQHRDICTSDVKELRYFTPLRYGGTPDPVTTYAAHFRGCERSRYALEATPGYFYGGRPVARGLAETCPGARVILSFRSPVDRCWSWYGFVKSRLRIPKEMTFEEYLDRCEELHRAGVDGEVENQPFWGLGAGCYDRWLGAWVDQFGSRLQVVFFDDLVRDPAAVVEALCAWLAVDTSPVRDFTYSVDNKTQLYRNKRLQAVAVNVNRRTERLFHDHQGIKRALRRGYYAVNRAPAGPRMHPATRRRLLEFYQPHNASLASQLEPLGLALPASWST
jgi:hypothetical protein